MNHTKYMIPTVATAATLFLCGCSSVVKQNVISTVNTGFGLHLAENPQTQLYELKVGYLRSQFYSIPTTKGESGDNAHSITSDIGTPQVVSGIGGGADINGRKFGGSIAENFAVGEKAVASPAAVMMYMATARSPESANAMAKALKSLCGQEKDKTP